MTTYLLCKIREGKRQVWLDWCSRLMTEFKEEARLTLKEEDLVREMCMVFDHNYVVFAHETVDGKVKKPFNADRELNRMHDEKFKECLEIVHRLKGEGYDIFA